MRRFSFPARWHAWLSRRRVGVWDAVRTRCKLSGAWCQVQIGSDGWIAERLAERLGLTWMEDRDIEIEKRKTVDDIRPEETAHEAAMAKEPRQGDEVGHAGCARNASEATSRTAYLERTSILNTIERTRSRSIWLPTCTCTHARTAHPYFHLPERPKPQREAR